MIAAVLTIEEIGALIKTLAEGAPNDAAAALDAAHARAMKQ